MAQSEIESNRGNGKRKKLRLLSLNVWFGLGAYHIIRLESYQSAEVREERYRCVIAGIKQYSPDIVFLQEANPLPKYARRLSSDLAMDRSM